MHITPHCLSSFFTQPLKKGALPHHRPRIPTHLSVKACSVNEKPVRLCVSQGVTGVYIKKRGVWGSQKQWEHALAMPGEADQQKGKGA
jgi:hypothetical protein